MEASVNAMSQQIVEGVSAVQDISGLHAQIIANATVIHPIITTFDPNRTLAARVPELFVITARQGNSVQAAVVFSLDPAPTVPRGHYAVTKDVLIKGPTANTTRTSLEALLRLTEDILGSYWGTHIRLPQRQYAQAGVNGGVHYKR